jgi:hypothetical protein
MTIAGAPLASAAEQNSAYARNKEGRFGKPGRPSLCVWTEFRHEEHEGLEGRQTDFLTELTELPNFAKLTKFGGRRILMA